MIKSLSKTEYFKNKNIPLVSFCRKLEPEQPPRTHLIEALPRLGTQLEKIKSLKNCQNRVNLELANALKIIHQLQYELQIVTEKYQENEEELLCCRNEKKQLERRITKLEDRILGLQGQIKKNEFNMKAKIQSDKEQYYSIAGHYERKIEELTYANNKLKNDRENELKSAQKFHEVSLEKINSQLHSFQQASQSQIGRYQKQVEKVRNENQDLLKKIADLEKFNQQHLQEIKNSNAELLQTNLQTKIGLEQKILALHVELDLSVNKNKELLSSLEINQKKLLNATQNWIAQRNALACRQLENENSWKKSYDQLIKRKQNIIQQLNKRSAELSEKDRQLITMTDQVKKLERTISELKEDKRNLSSQYEKYKIELSTKYEEDYEFKINETKVLHQRELSRRINEVVEREHRLLKQKNTSEIQRYLQKITSLEAQLMQISHEKLCKEQLVRKLQLTIEQNRIEIEGLIKSSKEQTQSLNLRIQNLASEYESRIKCNEVVYLNELEKQKGQNTVNINTLKNQHQNKVKELLKNLESKEWERQNFQNRLKKVGQDYANQRMSFISRVQSFEMTVGKMKNENEQLLKKIKNLELNFDHLERQNRNIHNINHQEAQIKQKLENQFKILSQFNEKLKIDGRAKQENYGLKIKEFEGEIYEYKKKNSLLHQEIENLKKVNRDLALSLQNLNTKLKNEEGNRINLQRKLCDIDSSSQEKWRIIESDFMNTNKRLIEDSQKIEKDLRFAMRAKQEQINKMAAKVEEFELLLIQERNQFQISNANWSIKLNQLEQQNKNLMQSITTMEDLKNANYAKQATISELQKQTKRLTIELEQKDKHIFHLNNKIAENDRQKERLNSQLQQKTRQFTKEHQKASEIENQCRILKEKSAVESKTVWEKQAQTDQELNRQRKQNQNLHKQLRQEANKCLNIFEERKKIQFTLQELTKQLKESERQRNLQKLQANKKFSQLQSTLKVNEASFKQRVKQLQIEVSKKNESSHFYQMEAKRLMSQIKDLEVKMLQNDENFKKIKQKLDEEKFTSKQHKQKLQKLMNEKEQFERKITGFIQHIERLEKQTEKTEKQIIKIYEEGDKRVQIAYEETKVYYEKELEVKNIEIDDLRKKTRKQLEEEREGYKRRQAQVTEEKQQLYKETIEKTCKITEITNAYEQLSQTYEHVFKELQVYKKKWNKMFCEFTDTNEELAEANIKISDFRTDDKKNKKVVRQLIQVRTQKTEKFMTTAGNETPISQNIGSKLHETIGNQKSVNAFDQISHSQNEALRRSSGMARPAPVSTLVPSMANKEPSLDVSVRQDWSSTSSKFSFKD